MYRILLVEDEKIELETLRDYIDWEKNGISQVYTARNGKRALECIEEYMPEIILTDIQMPGMNGIELAQTVVERGYGCKIIFLTGYDDFSYVKAAFQVSATDYLLKPFTVEEVERCLAKVREELERTEVINWSRKTAAGKLLEQALREKIQPEELDKKCMGVWNKKAKELQYGTLAVYGRLQETIIQKLRDTFSGIQYVYSEEWLSIVLLASYIPVKDTAVRIWNFLKEEEQKDYAVGWSNIQTGMPYLYAVAQKYRQCKDKAFFMEPQALFALEDQDGKTVAFTEPDRIKFQEMLSVLCRQIGMGKERESLAVLEEYLQLLKEQDRNLCVREGYSLYLGLRNHLVLEDAMLEKWMAQKGEMLEKQILEADSFQSMKEEIRKYILHMLSFFQKQQENPAYYAVSQVKGYLQEHCSEPIDIEKIAGNVGLSPNYLRSLFKEATGKTILEYSTELRMQKAAELLKDKSQKVRSVSLAVGYENVSYFGVVFQKRFGVTPNEYRKMV